MTDDPGQEPATPLGEYPDVLVCRSKLDPSVWFPSVADREIDSGEWAARLMAVRYWAKRRYAGDRPVRWERLDEDTWRMLIADGDAR